MVTSSFEHNGIKINFTPILKPDGVVSYQVSDNTGNIVEYAAHVLIAKLVDTLFDYLKEQL